MNCRSGNVARIGWMRFGKATTPVGRLAKSDKSHKGIQLDSNFSRIPLRAFYYLAALFGIIGLLSLAQCFGMLVLSGSLQSRSLIVGSITLCGSILMLGIAILGECIAKGHEQTSKLTMYLLPTCNELGQNLNDASQVFSDPVQQLMAQINELQTELREARSDARRSTIGDIVSNHHTTLR